MTSPTGLYTRRRNVMQQLHLGNVRPPSCLYLGSARVPHYKIVHLSLLVRTFLGKDHARKGL